MEACPVEWIRAIQPDGNAVLIGGIWCRRCERGEFLGPEGSNAIDWEHKDELREENLTMEPGDPDIVWTIQGGWSRINAKQASNSQLVFLAPSWHGQGIASDAIKTVLYDWLVPRMGVRRVLVFPLEGNHGGVKAFLKSDFRYLGVSKSQTIVRGMARRVNVLEWRLDDEGV